MKRYWMILAMLVVMLAGCGSNEQENQNSSAASDEMPKEVKVEVKTNPETIQANQNVEIQAVVTQDGKAVNDADEVKFEVWKDGQEQHEMTVAEAKGDGVYAIQKAFSEDGVYNITAHTNARDMHVMPTVQVTVGATTTEQATETDHHHSEITIGLMVDDIKAGGTSPLQAHVQQSGAALTGAGVQFEIWKDGAEQHTYVEAKEGANGQYDGSFTFEAGTYHINVHVVKGELHQHQEQTITVQ